MNEEFDRQGRFGEGHQSFIAALEAIRPRLHRYCARMTGSPFDGEDIAQEAIFEAFRKSERYDPSRLLEPWVVQIAHNRCIDFIRHRNAVAKAEHGAGLAEETIGQPVETSGPWIERALEGLVTRLPPKERACILLKDVFDYSLEETAALVGSTVGGVKAALKRGRTKLSTSPPPRVTASPTDAAGVLSLYAERFNRRDWDAVRELIRDDALLRISDIYAGSVKRQYFTTFEKMAFAFRLVPGRVDGQHVLMLHGGISSNDTVSAIILLETTENQIWRIRHYTRCPWLLQTASHIEVNGSPEDLDQQPLVDPSLARA